MIILYEKIYICLSDHSYHHHTDRVIFEEDRTGLVLDQGEETGQGEHHGEGHEHHQHQPRVQRPTHSREDKLMLYFRF